MGKHADSVDSKLLRRIRGHKRGWVFTPTDFADLGSRTAVDNALMRHVRDGTIKQLARGLYHYPKTHPLLGQLSASTDSIAKALAGRDATRLQPSGANAANLIGLSEQVPMQVVYLTDGPAKRVQVGSQQIVLRRTTPRNMATAGRISGLVIQALRYFGQQQVDDSVVAKLKCNLSKEHKLQLLEDVQFAPVWIGEVIRRVATDNDNVKWNPTSSSQRPKNGSTASKRKPKPASQPSALRKTSG